ncbi:MAG: two-component regulator propeller domain-containing protein, partial [Pseudomonadota bacterium]
MFKQREGLVFDLFQVLVLTLLLCSNVLALNPSRLPTQYIHDRYTRADGLPAGAVWTVVQDADGYLWVGTQNGLARFDGVRFTIYDASNTPGMASQDIRDIVIDPSGQIWLASYGGGVYRFNRGEVESISTEQGLPHNVVYDLLIADDGSLWIGTAGGLARRGTDGAISSWTQDDGLSVNRVFKVFEDDQGMMWLATFGGGLSRFDGSGFVAFGVEEGLVSNQVHDIFQDRDGRLLVGTYEGGFQEFKDGRLESLPLDEGLAGLAIQTMLEDGNGNLWLASYGNGLIRYSEGDVAHLTFGALAGTVISEMIEDAEGSLWLATRDGLQRLRDGKFTVFGQSEGLSDTTFVVTGEAGSDVVWVGTEGRGLFRMEGNSFQQWSQAENGLASDNISAITLTPDGEVWAASFGAGLNRIRGGEVEVYGREAGLPSEHLFALELDSEQRLWVASSVGISVLDEGVFRNFSPEDGLPAAAIRQLFGDSQGRLWIGSNGGGLSLMIDDEIVRPEFHDMLPGTIVHAFHEDEAGRIWMGFRDGGLGLLREDGRFVSFGLEQGLPSVSVNAIEQDMDGHLWLATGSGLVCASIAELLGVADGELARIEAEVFTESDGLRSIQFTGGFQPTSWRDRSGQLWFTSTAGVVRVNPDQLNFNDRPPPVRIERLLVDGVSVDADQPVALSPDAVNLEIDYTGLSLVSPTEVQFRYRLLGYDRDWQSVGSRRTAYYTGLPNGSYVFQVLARNDDGVWSPEPAQI